MFAKFYKGLISATQTVTGIVSGGIVGAGMGTLFNVDIFEPLCRNLFRYVFNYPFITQQTIYHNMGERIKRGVILDPLIGTVIGLIVGHYFGTAVKNRSDGEFMKMGNYYAAITCGAVTGMESGLVVGTIISTIIRIKNGQDAMENPPEGHIRDPGDDAIDQFLWPGIIEFFAGAQNNRVG